MATKTVALTAGSTWTPSGTGNSDFYGATNVTVIVWGSGANGVGGSGGCVPSSGAGGASGCLSQITNYSAPASGSINIQIASGGSSSQTWFGSSSTVAANSETSTTTGGVGSTLIGGNNGANGGGCSGGAGGGAPGISTQGGAPAAGSPSYTATAGGTFGPGTGGAGGVNGQGGTLYGAGGGGGGFSGCGGGSAGGGTNGLIIVIYTPFVAASSVGFNMPMLGMCLAGLVTAAVHVTQFMRNALCFLRPAHSA
jgi:hypothetical protein